jgi:hypothetical protein
MEPSTTMERDRARLPSIRASLRSAVRAGRGGWLAVTASLALAIVALGVLETSLHPLFRAETPRGAAAAIGGTPRAAHESLITPPLMTGPVPARDLASSPVGETPRRVWQQPRAATWTEDVRAFLRFAPFMLHDRTSRRGSGVAVSSPTRGEALTPSSCAAPSRSQALHHAAKSIAFESAAAARCTPPPED